MDYKTTENLFNSMDNIETYARLCNNAMDEAEIDWGRVNHYKKMIDDARNTIFKIATSREEDV